MRILLTNDDGIDGPGLQALYEAVADLPEVEITVIAPDRNWSISGHNKTMDRPLRVNEVKWFNGQTVFSTDGAPADCVSLAGLGLMPELPDLVLSGINTGPNLGDDVTYSGTVAAAMEAHIAGVPALAFSVNAYIDHNFDGAARFARRMVTLFQKGLRGEEGGLALSSDLLLNVNVPNLSFEELGPVEITRQGRRIYRDELFKRLDPRGRPYYWIGGERPGGHITEGTDIAAIEAGRVSITPLMLDLTNFSLLEKLKDWQL